MKEFRNEPILELRRAPVRAQLADALAAHDAKPPVRVPVWVGDERREGDARADLQPVAAAEPVTGLRVADRDDQRGRGEQGASESAPALVLDELEQEEIRQQKGEEARVAVEQPDLVPPPNPADRGHIRSISGDPAGREA